MLRSRKAFSPNTVHVIRPIGRRPGGERPGDVHWRGQKGDLGIRATRLVYSLSRHVVVLVPIGTAS